MLDLQITHERFGSSSDPSINGHLHYPNDVDRSLNETNTDKMSQYHTDYNNNPPDSNSFIPTVANTSRTLSLMCVYYQSKKKISEQPCSNGDPISHTVLWEGIRTTHKLPGSLMGHAPMGTTDVERCVERIQCAGSPPPPSSHHHDRTRTLVSWAPRHIVTPLPSQTSNENRKSTNISIRDRWRTSVKTRRVHRYWYSSP